MNSKHVHRLKGAGRCRRRCQVVIIRRMGKYYHIFLCRKTEQNWFRFRIGRNFQLLTESWRDDNGLNVLIKIFRSVFVLYSIEIKKELTTSKWGMFYFFFKAQTTRAGPDLSDFCQWRSEWDETKAIGFRFCFVKIQWTLTSGVCSY